MKTSGKYHVTDKGEVEKCEATVRPCKYGAENVFESRKEAEVAQERLLEEKNDLFSKFSKRLPPEMITLSSNMGSAEVVDGDLHDSRARLLLSTGLCGDLAYAIHQKTGWPITFVMYRDFTEGELQEEFEKNPKIVFSAQHVMVKPPTFYGNNEQYYLDSYGLKTEEEVEEFYEGVFFVDATPEMGRAFAGEDYRRLDKFAETAIDFESREISYDYEDAALDYDDEDDQEEFDEELDIDSDDETDWSQE